MTASSITPSRLAALALAAAAIVSAGAGLWAAIPGPLAAREARIGALRAEISKLEKQKARLGDLNRWNAAREQALSARADFLSKDAGASSAALLQGAMRKTANDAGLSVISTQDFSPSIENAAGVRMSVNGDLNELTQFLVGLSTGSPRLFVDELVIRPAAGEANESLFTANVSAVAFYWTQGGQS